ncbi:hypothetical protein ACQUQU_02040 [Thalassolituus sp. LLYu03]|uniref:hypothetical protein n=1 Tax=Thalassolituus sp. LLYu03 TaxID=3421656 RepID=UPI003D29C499
MSVQSGYSLLQLLLAAGLLCVLLFVVVMAYQKLLAQAQLLQIQATAASLRTSVLQAQEQWYVNGRPTGRLTGFADDNLLMSERGWPIAVYPQEQSSPATHSVRCQNLWQALLDDQNASSGTDTDPSHYAPVQEGERCIYRFKDRQNRLDATADIEYDMSNGRVTLTIR